MSFEKVNVDSLRRSIYTCKNAINHSTSTGLIGELNNNEVWQGDARKPLIDALTKLTQTRYQALKKELDECLQIAEKIEKYQEYASQNEKYQNRHNKLVRSQNSLDKEKDSEEYSEKKRQIRQVNQLISENDRVMDNLKSQINTLLNK